MKAIIFIIAVLIIVTHGRLANVKVTVDTTTYLHAAREEFLSFALDHAMLNGEWGEFNFSDPGVVAMAQGLSPAILRSCGTLPHLPSGDSQRWPEIQVSNWDRLVKLTRSANLTILFDAYLMDRTKDNRWNSSRFIEFLDYIDKSEVDNIIFELGNEPIHYNTVNGSQLAADFVTFNKTVKSFPRYKNKLIVGADFINAYRLTLDSTNYIYDFFKRGHSSIDAFTWHQYYVPPTATVEKFIDAGVMDQFPHQISIVNSIIHSVLGPDPKFPLWMGETGSAYGGGAPNISNTYVAGFLWMDKLGVAARSGYDVVIRQTFFGGWYSLIDKELNPYPDYWLSLLYKRLVGTKALSLSLSANNSVRAYASCTNPRYGVEAGSVTVYAMNLDRLTSAMISVDMKYNSLRSFNMEPTDGTLTSLHVNINGERMRLVNKTLPEIHANITDYIVLKPLTFGFFVLVGANATACM